MQQLGKYQLIRKLATGGMAEVFLAKAAGPRGFEKTLVLKRILPHMAEDPTFVEMFLGEAKLAAQLNHPNIVQIFDFGEADDAYFLAMEYIDGPNLRTLLKRAIQQGQQLPPALCARLIASACEGLAFAHDFQDPATGEPLELIHRDISPDNILVSRQGAVKVVDFGIAKAAGQSHKTQSGVIKGKLAYMPPEQLRASALDRRVDVYALGVVLYELLTGAKPFNATSDVSLMQAILYEPLVPARERRPELPEALHHILERALAKDRAQRYPDCLTLQAELEEYILSVGKPVTNQQLAQLISQVVPSTDAQAPTPQAGLPRGTPKPSASPVYTPAPPSVGTDSSTRSDRHLAQQTPSTKDMVAPVETRVEAPVVKTVPHTRPELLAPTEKDTPVAPSPSRRWLLAAVGGVLLVAGGGLILSRMSSTPEPVTPPMVAQPSNPGATTPAPEAQVPSTAPAGTPPVKQEASAANTPAPVTPPPAETKPAEPKPAPPPVIASATPAPSKLPANKRTSPSRGGKEQSTPKVLQPAAPVVGKGTLAFRVRPYATVIINGKNLGQTPFEPVEFPAGTYSVRFINDDLKKNILQTVELKPGETKVVKLNLEE